MTSLQTVHTLWRNAGLPLEALESLRFTGQDPVLPSSFAIGQAAQVSMAAAGLVASSLGLLRGEVARRVSVDMTQAAMECAAYFSVDGQSPELWDPIAGLYACGQHADGGWLRLHTNFAHHRDGVLSLLNLPLGPTTSRENVAKALCAWSAESFEEAATRAGLVVAAARSFEQWDQHPQARVLANKPLIQMERIGDAAPLCWPAHPKNAPPLQGLKVLDLTRILAGPVCGRTLAQYGAEVMLVNSPHLPNIASIADTSRGKLSAHIDLRGARGKTDLQRLLQEAHVFVQGYRPGAIASHGFDPEAAFKQRPGLVYVSLSAYGDDGPWAGKRGFDSLVQTATGFNVAEALAAGSVQPKALPVQILDYATGFLMAFGAQAALHRQAREGGSWLVQLSLARTGQWLRSMGQVDNGFEVERPAIEPFLETSASGFGLLRALRHGVRFDAPYLAPYPFRPSMPPGSHPPHWST
jgi:CoA-transferase family III